MNREEILQVAKPILFNAEMVRAILDGRKTVTRRAIKFPEGMTGRLPESGARDYIFYPGGIKYPPYHAEDMLYVRETWIGTCDEYYYRADFESDYLEPCTTLSGGTPAECRFYPGCEGCTRTSSIIKWRPSIHMPKEAARIFLHVTNVTVAKLQEITEEQAKEEGISEEMAMSWWSPSYYDPDSGGYPKYRDAFSELWDSTVKKSDLGKYGWAANPWVWVIEFEKVEVQ
jgi:hypothetical protein